MSARTQKKSNVLSQDEHSHSLPLLRDWLNDITCKPITSHSSSRDASKQNRTVRGEIERPKTTTDLSTLKISPLSNHLLISNSISPSTTRLQPLQGKQSSSSSSMIEVNQSVRHPLMDKLLVFSNVHKELTRQAAFHCPSLANLLHRSWSGVSSLASTAVVKLYDAEAKYRLTDSRCERLTSDMSLNLDAIVSERNLLRSENQKLQGQCDNHESDALRHRKELALAQLDADTAHFRLEKTASAALSGSARILSKRLEKEKGAETIKVKKNDDNEHEVNAVTSRGILELTLLFSELEKERAQQKSLAEELKAYVGSTALTIMLQNQWWLPKPSRSVGVQWVDDPADLQVDPRRGDAFYAEVRKYWPGLADGALQAGYAGIRPKINAPHEVAADFLIQGPAEHGVPGLVNLLGIESPGLTSSLAIADEVCARLA
jgi:hypothetical protein